MSVISCSVSAGASPGPRLKGGSLFTFCGYHDSFSRGADRIRYAVLPFPCDQGQFTCFVDSQEEVNRAARV